MFTSVRIRSHTQTKKTDMNNIESVERLTQEIYCFKGGAARMRACDVRARHISYLHHFRDSNI